MRKPFLTYFLICAVPLLLLAALNYWNATRSVAATANAVVQDDLQSFNAVVDRVLNERGQVLLKLAVNPDVQSASDDASLEPKFDASFKSVFAGGSFKSLALYNERRQPLWVDTTIPEEAWHEAPDRRMPPARFPLANQQVWTTQGNVLLEQLVANGSFNDGLNYSVPVHDATGLKNKGAVVGLIEIEKVFATAAATLEARSGLNHTSPAVVVRDSAGRVIYPSQAPSAHASEVTASAPLPRLNVTVAVSRATDDLRSSARRWGIAGFALALSLALLVAFLLDRHVRARSRGIERVEEDLSAIAKGDIDRRIILQSSDDARAIADNINAMTEQLRAQIAREEESRQFESFLRLSAMLTHDLKNAIEGLSLTVSNMERHFDNEQFRIDAMKGLTNATDKLKALVARLSRPVNTLSGEHKRPTEIDLVPILKRVIAMTAEPVRGKHTIQTKLPANLYAFADATRIEEVIENLILNALEAMGDQSGTLTVEAGPNADGAPSFSVSDTGPGMTRAFIENRLFRPFSTTKKNGIGLGLYTCREVIRASGGSIEVQSGEGAGTTFRVVLPSIQHDRRN